MSRNEPGRYQPPPERTQEHEQIRALERELVLARRQVRSLEAEVHRLQPFVPRQVLKGERRLTRREKMNGHAHPAGN